MSFPASRGPLALLLFCHRNGLLAGSARPKTGWPTRTTENDDMTLAELIGLPDLDERAAIEVVLAMINTKSAAQKHLARQIDRRRKQKRSAKRPRPSRRHPLRADALRLAERISANNPVLKPATVAARIAAKMEREGIVPPSEKSIANWIRAEKKRLKKR